MVSVGKRSGRHSKAQESINDLLLNAAREEEGGAPERRRPLDLRAQCRGDGPSGRGRCALSHLSRRHHGQCGGGGWSGLVDPARRGAGITFVTAHLKAGEPLKLDWETLARPEATLGIYMGRAAAPRSRGS
jgi:uroporphyrin-III C-methyltransferase